MSDFSKYIPAVNALLKHGEYLDKKSKEGDIVRSVLVNPVFFVLCCVADKNADADIVWNIPNHVPNKSFPEIEKFSREQWEKILKDAGYNRPTKVSMEYVLAIKQIRNKYDGHAEKIWTESKSFSEIIVKFLEFKGIGKKIATMAANMLSRYAGVGYNFSDKHFMDISPDTHVKQIFNMLGFVDDEHADDTNIVVYMARALNPDAPYLLDYPCYDIGKHYCKKRGQKKCADCPVKNWCRLYNKNI